MLAIGRLQADRLGRLRLTPEVLAVRGKLSDEPSLVNRPLAREGRGLRRSFRDE